jgi:hypothetical protein
VAIGDARAAFFDAASTAVQLPERPELAGHWTDGSVLQQFSVAGLAGHLVRGMTTVERYLDGPEPRADVSRQVATPRGPEACWPGMTAGP